MSYPLMINSFPGSDDTRGTTTRVKKVEPQPVGSGYTPEIRLDELEGTLGDALRFYNLTKFTANYCREIDLSGITNVYSALDFNVMHQSFIDSLELFNDDYINPLIETTRTSLGLPDAYSFQITKVDIINQNLETGGIHNESGTHQTLVSINWDCIIYGQLSPNPYIEPEPAPIPCACFAPTWIVSANFGNSNNNGIAVANSDTPTGVPQVLGHIYVKAMGRAILNATATLSTALFLAENTFYTLKYDISANLIPIITPGTNIELTVKVHGVVVAVIPLDTNAKSGYISFTTPIGWTSPYSTVIFTYSKAFGDRTSYPSQEMWSCKFEICNDSCSL